MNSRLCAFFASVHPKRSESMYLPFAVRLVDSLTMGPSVRRLGGQIYVIFFLKWRLHINAPIGAIVIHIFTQLYAPHVPQGLIPFVFFPIQLSSFVCVMQRLPRYVLMSAATRVITPRTPPPVPTDIYLFAFYQSASMYLHK